jgi:hypothetical protein
MRKDQIRLSGASCAFQGDPSLPLLTLFEVSVSASQTNDDHLHAYLLNDLMNH